MRQIFVLSVLLITVIVASSCGSGSEIAKIGSNVTVSQASYDRWLASTTAAAAKAGQALDPPGFEKCAKNGGPAAKKTCQSQYQNLKKQVFAQLIQQGWILAAADKAGVKFSDNQLQQQMKTLRKQYPQIDGGLNDDDLIELAKVNATQAALQQKTLASIKPTNAQLASFYAKNKKQFAIPKMRDIDLLVTSSKSSASKAADELRGGASWNQVFKKYNDEKLYNSRTPEAKNVSSGNFAPDLSKVIFAAPLKTVYGPKQVKQIKGWAVVEVSAASQAKPAPSFSKNKPQALAAYRSQMLSERSPGAPQKLAKTWQPQTVCAQEYKSWYPCKGTKPFGQ